MPIQYMTSRLAHIAFTAVQLPGSTSTTTTTSR